MWHTWIKTENLNMVIMTVKEKSNYGLWERKRGGGRRSGSGVGHCSYSGASHCCWWDRIVKNKIEGGGFAVYVPFYFAEIFQDYHIETRAFSMSSMTTAQPSNNTTPLLLVAPNLVTLKSIEGSYSLIQIWKRYWKRVGVFLFHWHTTSLEKFSGGRTWEMRQ